MKKDNRQHYLDTWREYLKGKNQIDPKALAEFLKDKLQKEFNETTLKRYTATIIANLYENGFLAGKKGKTFAGEPLELVREITPYILDQALTQNYKKVKFSDLDKPAEMVESLPEAPKAKKPGRAAGKKKVEKPKVAAKKPAKKVPAKKPAKEVTVQTKKPGRKAVKAKTQAEKPGKPGPKKMTAAKTEKPARKKPGPKKKMAEKPEKAVAVTAKKKPGRKPGRKPGKKAAALVPAVIGRKRGPQRIELAGGEDLVKMGESAFIYFLELQRQVKEMGIVIANYERMFEAVRQLFSREMEEIEDLVAELME